MDILNIKTFLTIVETQSLSKASEKLFVSQSTISARLNALEKELNTTLLKRQPGKKLVELTPKGEEFIMIAKRWTALEKDTHTWISKEPPLRLNIGAVDSINIYVLSTLLNQMMSNGTPLTMDISSHSSIQVFDLLESYDIDIGLTSRLIRSNSLLGEPVFSEGMVLVSSSTNSHYKDKVHPQDLDVKNEIFSDWGPNFQVWHDYWWDPAEPKKITVDTAGLILQFINIPNTWAIVPTNIAHAFKNRQPVNISELLVPPDERIYYKVIHRYPKPSSINALKIFQELLEEFIRNHPYLKVAK